MLCKIFYEKVIVRSLELMQMRNCVIIGKCLSLAAIADLFIRNAIVSKIKALSWNNG